ncbi:hypothetical protein BGX38DRAFT_1184340, partial [Terfezia claveryi]
MLCQRKQRRAIPLFPISTVPPAPSCSLLTLHLQIKYLRVPDEIIDLVKESQQQHQGGGSGGY